VNEVSGTERDDKKEVKSEQFRLFVVGERSGDPSKWSRWTSKMLVLARDEAHAIELSDGYALVAALVETNVAGRLMTKTVNV